MQELFAVNLIN